MQGQLKRSRENENYRKLKGTLLTAKRMKTFTIAILSGVQSKYCYLKRICKAWICDLWSCFGAACKQTRNVHKYRRCVQPTPKKSWIELAEAFSKENKGLRVFPFCNRLLIEHEPFFLPNDHNSLRQLTRNSRCWRSDIGPTELQNCHTFKTSIITLNVVAMFSSWTSEERRVSGSPTLAISNPNTSCQQRHRNTT